MTTCFAARPTVGASCSARSHLTPRSSIDSCARRPRCALIHRRGREDTVRDEPPELAHAATVWGVLWSVIRLPCTRRSSARSCRARANGGRRGGDSAMNHDNVALARRLYDAFAVGDVPTVLAAFDDKIEWREAE